ncbi:MAG: metal ABC transporter ATP-binding protein [Treponemataceae bacterium]
MNNRKALIHIEGLTMAYQQSPVLWDIDLDIYEGMRTAIVGPNGAGKSTLLKGILGLLKPVAGIVTVFGKPVKSVRNCIAYIPQINAVNWNFPTTVYDVVLMGRYGALGWLRRPKKADREIAWQALEEMGMQDYAKRQISQLSGGQRQRVFIARALCQKAQVYLMDEPFAGVDRKTESVIAEKFLEFKQAGKTLVCVHHDLNTLDKYFDRLVLLNRRIIAEGAVSEVFTEDVIRKTYDGGDAYPKQF